MAKIQVKPVSSERWHGKKGAESFKRPHSIPALVDAETLTYKTGLDYFKKSFTHPDNPEIKLTEAEYYGLLLKQDLSNQFDTEKPHPFWDSKMSNIKLENRTMFFDPENPIDYVRIKILKASKYVANSLTEHEEGLWPEATHVIFDEAEEIESLSKTVELKKQATIECAKLSKDKKIALIMVLSADGDYLKARNLKGKSDAFVEVELSKIIESNAEGIIEFINRSPEQALTHAMVLECLQRNVLYKEGHRIKYHESVIGESVADAVDYLLRPEQSEFKLRLTAQIN